MKAQGNYDAKTHLPQLLERVACEEKILITRHGKPVAMLVPADKVPGKDLKKVIREIQTLRRGNVLGPDVSIRELIDEGRNH